MNRSDFFALALWSCALVAGAVSASETAPAAPDAPPAEVEFREGAAPDASPAEAELREGAPDAPPAEAEFREGAMPAGGAVDIPAVIDRPLGIDEGPRIRVSRFLLLGAADYPRWGVRVAEIEALLEARRAHAAAAGGFTIGRLQALADEVSGYYRERGLSLAYAILPVQQVEDGEVALQVFDGRLGGVLVEGNTLYEGALLRKPFQELVGQPVAGARIESALLRVTDYPGLSAFGVFQPGQRVGEADLMLKVQEERRVEGSLRLDNQGTRRTGRVRVRPVIEWNNPTGGADRLRFAGQSAYNPENQRYWSAEYRRPLGRDYGIGFLLERNAFDVGGALASQEVAGETRNEGLYLERSLLRGRQRNLSAELRMMRKDSLTTRGMTPVSEDRLAVLQLRLEYDSVDIERRGLNFAYLTLARGFNDLLGAMGDGASGAARARTPRGPSRRGGSGRYAGGQFQKAVFGYTRLQTLTPHHSLLLRSELQTSADLLSPLEQFSMGGPESVRAYGVSELLWDRAAFLSAEYLIDAPFIAGRRAFGSRTWGELLQFSLFLDYAIGKLNDPLPQDASSYEGYGGAGWSLRLNVPGRLASRLMMAWSLGNREAENGRDPQLWFDLTLDF